MAKPEQRTQTNKPAEPQWALRGLVLAIALIILNFVLLARGTNSAFLFIDNVLATAIMIFFWSTIGEFLDKKLTYVSLLVFNKLEKSGLITVIEQEEMPAVQKRQQLTKSQTPEEKKKKRKTA